MKDQQTPSLNHSRENIAPGNIHKAKRIWIEIQLFVLTLKDNLNHENMFGQGGLSGVFADLSRRKGLYYLELNVRKLCAELQMVTDKVNQIQNAGPTVQLLKMANGQNYSGPFVSVSPVKFNIPGRIVVGGPNLNIPAYLRNLESSF